LLDSWGSRPVERELVHMMIDAGVQIHWFRPLRRLRPREVNHRTHRKILVVDELVGFTGGVGISDFWLGDAQNENEWRDTHFRIEGPAVDGLRAAFLDNWSETDPAPLDPAFDRFPEQPRPGDSAVLCIRGNASSSGSDLNALFTTLIQLAQRRLRMTTAYFVPDDSLVSLLCDAAESGVQVQILLPGPHADKRFVQWEGEADYARLLACGVELWNFQPSMLHAKVMTVDGILANVGSANFNARSLECDEEFNIVAFDPNIVDILDEHFDVDLERSVRIDPLRWKGRSLTQRSVEHLVTPLRRFS
jgi:cardiolipin synthase A/B